MKQAALQALCRTVWRPIPHIDEAIAAIDLPQMRGVERHAGEDFATASPAPDSTTSWRRTSSPPRRSSAASRRPILFLFAAEQMQAAPARCLVIEDSVPGIAAALAAGMTVLGFHGGSHCRPGHGDRLRAAGAAAIFDDMRQLPAVGKSGC